MLRVVDASGRRPLCTLAAALVLLAATWSYGSRLEPRSDFLELLPRDSPGFIAFEHQLGRGSASASLLVIAASPDRSANERLVDSLADRIEARMAERRSCRSACASDAACASRCGPDLVRAVERGTKDVQSFLDRHQLLYASEADLTELDRQLGKLLLERSGLLVDLGEELGDESDGGPGAGAALGLSELRRHIGEARGHVDGFPRGYFELPDGSAAGLRLVSLSTGTGDSAGDRLQAEVEADIAALSPGLPPDLKIGLAGDIPNASAEKRSLVSEAVWATVAALVVILTGVVLFYRSLWALPIIALPALLGVGFAYSFAMARYGYVNTVGAFLGAIILGNGINYPIILFSRHQEFRARGMEPDVARREAVWNAFRAELVGACVAAIAYGSVGVTRFRGFSQFGAIGFCGMLMVWLSMIPVVPALLSLRERLQPRLPPMLRDRPSRFGPGGAGGPLAKKLERLTARRPRIILAAAAILAALAAARLPSFLRDPWEYDFDKLGSRSSKVGGAGEWSNVADKVFGGKGNVAGAMMFVDRPDQTAAAKRQILANDRSDPQGPLIAEIVTVRSLLPGTEAEQRRKLELIERIRSRLKPGFVAALKPDERDEVRRLLPPAGLRPIGPEDLPRLLRSRFEERNGVLGAVFYVKYRDEVSLSEGHNLLRIARATDNVRLPDGTVVLTASRATVFAEIIRSLERDGPLATAVSLAAVVAVVIVATRSLRGATVVLASLLLSVLLTLGGAAWMGEKLNFLNFIALPITFGIGCEYPFNVYDRSRLLAGNIGAALLRVGGAVALCSYTTVIGYSSLLLADLQALRSFGWLAVSGELTCLLGALLVVPALLHVWKPARGSRSTARTS